MPDYNSESVATFDRNAARYAEKYFSLRDYDSYYQALTAEIPAGPFRFLDLACGPGNVSAYVMAQRPEAEILCVDQAPLMLEEASRRMTGIEVLLADCRDLGAVAARFHAAAFFFGLSYFNDTDAAKVLAELFRVMLPGAPLLLATVAGEPERSGLQVNAAGDRVFSFLRLRAEIESLVRQAGFTLVQSGTIPSPANASLQSEDVVIMARRS
jgi:ubiquinone/menaquinone biosynthesis C-methylase UbiE